MTRCPYRVDGLRCEKDFGHEEDHLHVIRRKDKDDLPIAWPYPEYLRDADMARGFARCQFPYPADADVSCDRPTGHEGDHEGTMWNEDTLSSEPVLWDDLWTGEPEPAPEPPKREVPVAVMAERSRRADMPTYLIAYQATNGTIERHEVLSVSHDAGSLLLRTPDEDILIPPGSWGALRMEPTPW